MLRSAIATALVGTAFLMLVSNLFLLSAVVGCSTAACRHRLWCFQYLYKLQRQRNLQVCSRAVKSQSITLYLGKERVAVLRHAR